MEFNEDDLAELQEDTHWVYLVTLDGDRALLRPVWEDEESGEEQISDPNEASFWLRYDCPE